MYDFSILRARFCCCETRTICAFERAGGFDKVVSVRDLAAGGLLLHEFQQERTVFKVVFSPDSRFLAAGGEDAVLQVYCPSLPPIPSEVPLSTLGELAESKPWILGALACIMNRLKSPIVFELSTVVARMP